MNYAHNNLRLKKIQFKIEKTKKAITKAYNWITPDTEETRLAVEILE